MAGLTKEQRLAKEAENEAKREQEIREKVLSELKEKHEKEIEALKSKIESGNDEFQEKQNSFNKKIPLELEVPVTSNYNGRLTFISKRSNGYSVEWDEYGMTEYMELGELLSMRNTDRRFYEDNWIILDDTNEYTADELYKFLKVDKYYKNVYSPENIEKFFELAPDTMIKTISTLSSGMKDCIASKAQAMITEGALDSNKKIDALSEALKVEFSKK